MLLKWIFALAGAQVGASPLTVMIDPGHGGIDNGAVHNSYKEAEITLKVSRKLVALLKRDREFKALLTREEDRRLSLAERAELARNKKADVFVSIHVNSSPIAQAQGAEFYFQNQLPPDEESMKLAHRENSEDDGVARIPYPYLEKNSFSNEVSTIIGDLLDGDRVLKSSLLSKALKTQWRGNRKSKSNSIRQAPFYVLSQMTVPSALVELGFITNSADATELTQDSSQQRMAEDLYRGLKSYKESIDKSKALP